MAYEYKSFLEEFFYAAITECENKDIYRAGEVRSENKLDKVIEKYAKTREESNEIFDAIYGVVSEYREQGFENGFRLGMKLAAAAFFEGKDRTS